MKCPNFDGITASSAPSCGVCSKHGNCPDEGKKKSTESLFKEYIAETLRKKG